jgi:aryl-alcohol dehydrogenase-like predicted oxidoreductase
MVTASTGQLREPELIYAWLETTFACMKQAYDCGINFFDTAERLVL